MKTIRNLSVAAVVCFNILLLAGNAFAKVVPPPEDPGLVKGLTGSVSGIPTCHCPDDAKTCYCNLHY